MKAWHYSLVFPALALAAILRFLTERREVIGGVTLYGNVESFRRHEEGCDRRITIRGRPERWRQRGEGFGNRAIGTTRTCR